MQARLDGGALRGADHGAAVQSHGQNAGDGGFANAAMSGKDVPVGKPVLRQGVDERARDMVLAGNVREALRTVFSRQNLVAHCGESPKRIVSGTRGIEGWKTK